MVKCIQTYCLIFTPNECKSFSILLNKASVAFRHPQESIRLFFVHDNGSQTEIENDADLLAVRYMARNNQI